MMRKVFIPDENVFTEFINIIFRIPTVSLFNYLIKYCD